MRRLLGLGSLFAAVVLFVPSSAHAQASVWIGGGATVPTGDFSDYAKTGWMAGLGLNYALGDQGLWIGGSGFYGSNKHETSGEKTNLYGGLAAVGYRVGDQSKAGVFFFGNVGVMNHEFDDGTTKDGSSKLAYGGGAGVDVPLADKINLWFAGQYLQRAKEDGEHTAIFGIFAGVSIALGSNDGM